MGSSIVTVKAALTTALQAAMPAGVQVTYGDAGQVSRKERVWIGDVAEAIHEPVVLKAGKRRREERYEVTLHVEVIGKPTVQANEERVLALVLVIEDALANDPTVSGSVPAGGWAVVAGLDMSSNDTSDGILTVADVRVLVTGRLL